MSHGSPAPCASVNTAPDSRVPTTSAVRGEANHEPAPRVISPRAPYSSPADWKGVVSRTITSSAR